MKNENYLKCLFSFWMTAVATALYTVIKLILCLLLMIGIALISVVQFVQTTWKKMVVLLKQRKGDK